MDDRTERATAAVDAIVREILRAPSHLRSAWWDYDEETREMIRARWVELVAETLPTPAEVQFNRAVDEATATGG